MGTFIKGVITGFTIVLPGMSGGTMLLILGLYENILSDISKFRLLRWLPFALAVMVGVLISGKVFTTLFVAYRDLTVSFLMGSIIASVKAVIGPAPKFTFFNGLWLLLGLTVGFLLAGEPVGFFEPEQGVNWILLFVGGALATAAMLIPGIPGSSVMIIMGIYDKVLSYLANMTLLPLFVYLVGGFVGLMSLAKLVDAFYARYRVPVSWFLSGLIVGSVRAMLPSGYVPGIVVAFIVGFALVWVWTSIKTSPAQA